MRILKKTIIENQKNWHTKLKFVLWASRVTPRRSTGKSPFELVYGTTTLFPSQLIKPVALFVQYIQDELSPLVRRMNKLIEFNERREKFMENLIGYQ